MGDHGPYSDYSFRQGNVWLCCGGPRLFSPQPWWSFLSNGQLVYSNGANPDITRRSLAGEVERRVSWKTQDRSLSRRDVLEYEYQRNRRVFADSSARFLKKLTKETAKRYARLQNFVSDRLPVVTQMLVDDQDRIWVRRFDRTRWPNGLSTTWDVFDADLKYLCFVQLPWLDYVFRIEQNMILGSQLRHGLLQRLTVVPIVAVSKTHSQSGPDGQSHTGGS